MIATAGDADIDIIGLDVLATAVSLRAKALVNYPGRVLRSLLCRRLCSNVKERLGIDARCKRLRELTHCRQTDSPCRSIRPLTPHRKPGAARMPELPILSLQFFSSRQQQDAAGKVPILDPSDAFWRNPEERTPSPRRRTPDDAPLPWSIRRSSPVPNCCASIRARRDPGFEGPPFVRSLTNPAQPPGLTTRRASIARHAASNRRKTMRALAVLT